MPDEVVATVDEKETDSPVEESSTSEEDIQGEVSDTPAEGEKTVTEEPQGETVDAEGQPIPYSRFKEVNDKSKRYESELEDIRGQLQDPDVLRVLMQKRGYTDAKINETLKQYGYPEPKTEAEKSV